MKDSNYVFRETQLIEMSDLPISDDVKPEQLVFKIPGSKKTVDIGSIAYKTRLITHELSKTDSHRKKRVINSSLLKHRKIFIVKLLDFYSLKQYRPISLSRHMEETLQFIYWADKNSHSNVLKSRTKARAAYTAYSEYLRECIFIEKSINLRSASARQNHVRNILKINFELKIEEITSGTQKIKFQKTTGGSEPPEKESIRILYFTNFELASSISKFLINGTCFPQKLNMPTFTTYLFPHCEYQAKTPFTNKIFPIALDTEAGRIRNIDELQNLYPDNPISKNLHCMNSTTRYINNSNANLRCADRMRAANLALGAYNILIGTLLGANSAEMCEFEYEEHIVDGVSVARTNFSTAKYRANGKIIDYSIYSKKGVRLIREYSKFRSWLLAGKVFKYFFMTIDYSATTLGTPNKLTIDYEKRHYKRCKGVFIDPNLERITPGQARKYKSYILKAIGYSSPDVADVLNHMPQTNLDSYNNSPASVKHIQWKSYFDSVRVGAKSLIEKNSINTNKSIPSGHCKNHGNPSNTNNNSNSTIKPNCRIQLGCLGCDNYVVHNDEQDIRKLLSLQYVVEYMSTNTLNINHADHLFSELIVRIEAILKALIEQSQLSKSSLSILRKDVFDNGHLTPFWDRHLNLFDRAMGIL